ncbi:peptide ABC transporter substrate-binding protein [Pilimelia anulata]|uniref:Peptide ABC transporter substrate-binding protein n=1 Tax=Pilimelia anulata TaxID=53371 RepID=A0A8J3BAM4_9ACTN|nr:ABC transporter substrate-binding protein [Pilimelia anulata]GGJ93448.1 peptide ABC transporter substrate-binding protein [Pilimelia anulata]
MRARWFVGTVAAALAVAAGAWAAAPDRAPAVGLAEPATLLPGLVADAPGRLVGRALWTPLTEVDAAGRAVPRLAAAVTSPDQRDWTVRLRPGWRFHDGTEVTAATLVGAWRAGLAQRWRSGSLLADTLRVHGATLGSGEVAGLREVDPHTVGVRLDAPFAELPAVLAAPALVPLPAAALAGGDWAAFARRPVGTGPYRLARAWRPGRGATLLRFADYSGPTPARAARLDLRVFAADAQGRALRAGNLDLATDVPPDRADDPGPRSRTWPEPAAAYLGFAPGDRRFADPTVRHALSLMIDREALAAGALGHRVAPLRALLPPAVPLARERACLACLYDEAAARAALGEVGGAPAGPIRLRYGPAQARWATALADRLGHALQVPIHAEPLPGTPTPDTPGAPNRVRPGAATPTAAPAGAAGDAPVGVVDGLYLVDHALPYPSADPVLRDLASAVPGVAGYLAGAAAAGDPAARLRDHRLAENLALRDLPLVPLWSARGHAAWSPAGAAAADDLLPAAA